MPLVITLIGALPGLLDAAKKISDLLKADGSDFVIRLQEIQAGAITTFDETIASNEDWLAKHPKGGV